MSQTETKVFGTIRSFVWPIYPHELRKFLPMLLIMYFVCFNYSILRNLKDALVVTTSGAVVIPFIKVWVMLPAAILLTIVFTRLSSRYSQESVFYIIVSGFFAFFAIFAFVLYPLRDFIHPHGTAGYFMTLLPAGFSGMVSMCCYWSFTIFYVMCELWGSLVLSVLFWGFANEVTRLHEARRFYSVLSIFSNVAAIIAGQAANYLAYKVHVTIQFPLSSADEWDQNLRFLILIVLAACLMMMAIFRWMNVNVLSDPSFDELHHSTAELKIEKKKKTKLSMKDSFSYLSNSKYLMLIAVLVLGYNLTMNLAEVVWKDRLREMYPSPADYNKFLNNLTSSVGVVSVITSLFMSRIIARFGWTIVALITPVIMLVTCAGFFSFMMFQDALGAMVLALTGLSPLVISVYFGAVQNCLSKAMKYSVFDATKEMAFIPLNHEVKLKGKAAIDGVGSRLGKSGGSLVHQSLILVFGNLSASASYVGVIVVLVISCWIVAVRRLGKQFGELANGHDQSQIAEQEKRRRQAQTAIPINEKPVVATEPQTFNA